MFKRCSKCLETKAEDNFRWRYRVRGIRTSWCKPCYSAYERDKWKGSSDRRSSSKTMRHQRRDRNREFVWEYLRTHPCLDCGERDPIVLEFDHRDPSQKAAHVSDLIKGNSLAVISLEIEKCDVVCANCHRKRTANQFGWNKIT